MMKKYFPLPFLLLFFLAPAAGCRSSVLDDPSTTIGFSLPEPSHVKVTITNNYNTVVATLLDEDRPGGSYSTPFNASGLLEGVYFYTIEVDGIGTNHHSRQTTFLLMIK